MNSFRLLWLNKYECSRDQDLADAACALTTWHHFSAWNDVMAAMLKAWRHIKNTILSINPYLLQEQSCQISSRSDLKWWGISKGFLWRASPIKNNNKKNKMSSDMRSVPDPKIVQQQWAEQQLMCNWQLPSNVARRTEVKLKQNWNKTAQLSQLR